MPILNGNVRDQNEAPVVGALVYIDDSTGDLANLTDDLDQVLTQPIVTGEDGYWEAYVESDGFYTERFFWGGRLRLVYANVQVGELAISGAPEATVAEIQAGSAGNRYLSPVNLFTSAAPVTLTDAATIAVNMGAGINFNVTLGGNRTLGNPTNAKPGQSGRIRVTQDGTGGRSLAYGSNWKHVGAVPVPSTTAGAKNIYGYFVNSESDIELSYLSALV